MNRAIIWAAGHAREVLGRRTRRSAARPPVGHVRGALRLVSARAGQATVEYLIVGLVLLVMTLALGALANRLEEGLFVEHAAESASHSLGPNTMGAIGDVLLY